MNETDSIVSTLSLKNQILSDSIWMKNDSLFRLLLKNQNEIISTISKSEEGRIIEFMPNDLFWTLIGGIMGIIISYIILLGKWTRDSYKYKKIYGKYEGYYVSIIANDENDPNYVLKLERKRNEFKIKGVSVKREEGNLKKRNENITGHITMGHYSKIFGIGQYQHNPDRENKIRSGEYRIQLCPDGKIIAIQNIIDNNLEQSIPKYVWQPINKSQNQEYLDFYNLKIK